MKLQNEYMCDVKFEVCLGVQRSLIVVLLLLTAFANAEYQDPLHHDLRSQCLISCLKQGCVLSFDRVSLQSLNFEMFQFLSNHIQNFVSETSFVIFRPNQERYKYKLF